MHSQNRGDSIVKYKLRNITDKDTREHATHLYDTIYNGLRNNPIALHHSIEVRVTPCYFIFILTCASYKFPRNLEDKYFWLKVTEEVDDAILESYSCDGLETVAVLLESFLHPITLFLDINYNGIQVKENYKQLYRGELSDV